MLACIGGPVEALEVICGVAGAKSAIGYISHLVQNIRTAAPFEENEAIVDDLKVSQTLKD